MDTPVKKISTRMIITHAILIAVMFVMMITPIGRLNLPFVNGTISHIPVLIATIVFGLYSGLTMAFVFGLFSLFLGLVSPIAVIDPFFANPLVSVLPRILIPITTYFTYRGLSAFLKKTPLGDAVAAATGNVIGTLTNSFGVYTILYLTYAAPISEKTGEPALSLLTNLISVSTIFKCVVVMAIATPLVYVLRRVRKEN